MLLYIVLNEYDFCVGYAELLQLNEEVQSGFQVCIAKHQTTRINANVRIAPSYLLLYTIDHRIVLCWWR